MADSFKISKRSNKAEKILRDPDKYFDAAWARARRQAERDLARAKQESRRQRATSS